MDEIFRILFIIAILFGGSIFQFLRNLQEKSEKNREEVDQQLDEALKRRREEIQGRRSNQPTVTKPPPVATAPPVKPSTVRPPGAGTTPPRPATQPKPPSTPAPPPPRPAQTATVQKSQPKPKKIAQATRSGHERHHKGHKLTPAHIEMEKIRQANLKKESSHAYRRMANKSRNRMPKRKVSTEKLREMIIFSEILGKPLAMREPNPPHR